MPLSQLLKSSGELKAELQVILNAVVEGLCGLDAQGNVTFCNDALLSMTGYRTEEFIGENLHELVHHSRPDGTRYPVEECPFQKAVYSRQEIHSVGEFWRKDGTCFPVEYWAHLLREPSSATCYVVTIQDMTEIQRARDVLSQSEERFRRILGSIPDVAWTADRHGRTIYVSPKVDAVFGYTKQEICAGGANLWRGCIHPEDFGRVTGAFRAIFDLAKPFDEEYRFRRKDGAWIWVQDRATGTREENGSLYADGVVCDITRRKLAEAELQSKTAFLEAQANSTIDGILVVDSRGQRLMQNQRFGELFHIPADLVDDQDDRTMLAFAVTLIKHPESFIDKVNYLYQHPDETSRDEIELKNGMILDRYSSPVVGRDGIYYGRIWIFRDITERKRNEDVLQQLSLAVEQSPVSVVITDAQANISYVNRKFTECTGYRPDEVVGKNPRFLNSGRNAPDLYRDLWSTLLQGNEWRGEFCNRRKGGEIFWESATISPITNSNGAVTHFLGIKEDITERRRAEKALKASEKRYRLLFERNLAGVLRTTLEGRVLECNQATARIFGYDSPEEIMAIPAQDLYDHASEREALMTRLKCERSVTNQEVRCRRKDGDSIWIIVNFSVVDDDSPESGIVEGTLVDITERKRAEEELYESRQMLQAILDAIPQRVFWKDRDSIFLGCNRALATDAGLDAPAEIIGKSDFDLAWRGVADLYRADDKLVMELGSPKLNFHERQSQPDGSELWLQTNKLPLRDREGKVTGVVATYEDITERRRAEKELQLTKSSLENTSDTVLWIDPQGHIVYANEAVSRKLGYSREEFLWLSIPDIDPLFPQEKWERFWKECKARGSMTFESQNKTKEGRIFPVEVTSSYLEFDGQEYAFAFARDISERRVLEGQLRQAQKLEGVGQLAAGIAHEINTPTQFVTDNLTFLRDSWKATHELLELYRSAIRNGGGTLAPGVVAGLEQAEQDCDLKFITAEVPRAIDQGLDGARRVAKIVRAMKEFSHPDSADKTATNLNQAIESTITVARNEWKYVAEITTEFDETLPPVVCYPGDINQVILNLVVNAAHSIKEKVKDGEKGRITVCTRTRGSDFVEISVTDTGAGIPEAIRTRIFEPFFTTKEVGKGTGQGLALAHTVVVKKHSGRIWFETQMGLGTTFFINLPIKPADSPKES